jgi:serine/threonine-protein kinase
VTSSRDDETFLEQLAEAILDGKSAPPASGAAANAEHAAVLRQAEILARIAHIHQNVPEDDTALGSVEGGSVPLSWGRLTILEELGRGTFGAVYRARDPRLERDVALKLLWPGKTDPDRFINSMVEEGRLLAQVHHPNVVSIYDANVIDGRVGLTMELVRGQTLAQEFQAGGPFLVRDIIVVGREIAHALAAVHEAGLLHRDVKSHNLMRRADGRLVLMDFGAGRRVERNSGEDAAITGTPLYLAPEVLEGYRATVQSDIYSLGVLLFHLLTGRYPVTGHTIRELRDAHQQKRRESLTSIRKDVPEALAGIIDRALAPVASQRWGSANDMANAMAAIRPTRPLWKRPAFVALYVAGFMIAASAFLSTRGGRNSPQASLTIHKMEMPPGFLSAAISSDGRYLAYPAEEGTRLMVRDLASGEDRELRGTAQNGNGVIEFASIARDNAYVAYSWESEAARELRIVDFSGRSARTLLRDATPQGSTLATTLMPVDWMPDGSAVLALRTRSGGTHDIALVNVDGTVRTLKSGLEWFSSMRLSHDGRYIAYDHPISGQNDARDISILSTETGAETRIVIDAAQDTLPVWMPDDRGVMFASDRSGSFGLWMVPVSSGQPTGAATMIKKDIGRIQSMTMTRSGELFHALQSGEVDVYVATLGPNGAVVPGSVVRPAASYLGSNMDPEWLPDGRSLAFVSRRRTLGPRRHALVVRDMTAGSEQTLWPDLDGFVEPRWSPDGKRVLVRGANRQGQPGPWLLDASTGAVLSRVNVIPGWDIRWMPDSRSVLAFRPQFVGRFDVDTGAVQELYRDAAGRRPSGVAVTSDGRLRALTLDSDETRALVVLSATGGAAREIFSANAPDGFLLQGFTREGTHLLVSRWGPVTSLPGRQWSLWRVPVTGGSPQPLNVSGYDLRGVTVSPDGTRIAYRTGEPEWDYWMMRNFLPKEGSE